MARFCPCSRAFRTLDGRGLVRLVAGQREACGLVAELVKCPGRTFPGRRLRRLAWRRVQAVQADENKSTSIRRWIVADRGSLITAGPGVVIGRAASGMRASRCRRHRGSSVPAASRLSHARA